MSSSMMVDTVARGCTIAKGAVPCAAGILKSLMGLCGSVFTTVYIGAFKPHGAWAPGPPEHPWPRMLCF